jgi:hypothetical protein
MLLCLIEHYAMHANEEWRYSSTILDLRTRWRWVVSFPPMVAYPWVKSPSYLFDRRLGGPRHRSDLFGEEKVFPFPGIEPWQYTPYPVYVVPTELFWGLYCNVLPLKYKTGEHSGSREWGSAATCCTLSRTLACPCSQLSGRRAATVTGIPNVTTFKI